jgi:hypothetical protein
MRSLVAGGLWVQREYVALRGANGLLFLAAFVHSFCTPH